MTQQLHFWVYTQSWSKELKRPLFTHAHSSIIQWLKGGNNPRVHRRVNGINSVVRPHGGRLFNLKKGREFSHMSQRGWTQEMPREMRCACCKGTNTVWRHLHGVPGGVGFIETEAEEAAGGGRWGVSVYWGQSLNLGRRVSAGDEGVEACTTLHTLNAAELRTWKQGTSSPWCILCSTHFITVRNSFLSENKQANLLGWWTLQPSDVREALIPPISLPCQPWGRHL